MSCVELRFEPGRTHLNDGADLTDRKLPKVTVIFVEVASMSL